MTAGRSFSDEELRIAYRDMGHWRGCPRTFEAAIADEIWRRTVEGQAIRRRRVDAEWAALNAQQQRPAPTPAVQTPAPRRPTTYSAPITVPASAKPAPKASPASAEAAQPALWRSGKDAAANQGED